MPALPSTETMYQALMRRDTSFDGVFFVGVKSTGIFCRPICPARKPLLKNVEFFSSRGDAVYAGYRPCKRCHPMDAVQQAPEWVRQATDLLERDPAKRIDNKTLRGAGIQPERIRRYFKQNYGMTFQAYARGRRLGSAFAKLREGQDVIEVAMDHDFESTSGFREAFRSVFGDSPSKAAKQVLLMRWIDTPLGAMIAAASTDALVLLEFADRRMLATQLKTLQRLYNCALVPGSNPILASITEELASYFRGDLRDFKTPIQFPGTAFQQAIWKRLIEIPYGETLSYGQMAADLGFPNAQRAVGKANGDNRLGIIVPCHRVVRTDGTLCGYGGGLWRKQRLLELERGQHTLV